MRVTIKRGTGVRDRITEMYGDVPELADLELQAESLLEEGSGAFVLVLDGSPLTNVGAKRRIFELTAAGVQHVVLWLVPASAAAALAKCHPDEALQARVDGPSPVRCWRSAASCGASATSCSAGSTEAGGTPASSSTDSSDNAVCEANGAATRPASSDSWRWRWDSAQNDVSWNSNTSWRSGWRHRGWEAASWTPGAARGMTSREGSEERVPWSRDALPQRFQSTEVSVSSSDHRLPRGRRQRDTRWQSPRRASDWMCDGTATGSDSDGAQSWHSAPWSQSSCLHREASLDEERTYAGHSASSTEGEPTHRRSARRADRRASTPSRRDGSRDMPRFARSVSPGVRPRGNDRKEVIAHPSADDRDFLRVVNRLASSIPGPGFGYTGPSGQTPSLRRGYLAFAKASQRALPELGALQTVSGGAAVDPECEFWLNGRARYLGLLTRYISFLGSDSCSEASQLDLLADLGCYLSKSFVTPVEEEQLLSYWRPGGSVYESGSYEQGTKRRFFHYGPILKIKTELSSKSTLGVIPGQFGAMPPVVVRMGLQERIRNHVLSLGDIGDGAMELDQLYVNHYSTKVCSGIGFHHDNAKTMMGTIAALSLGSACEMHLVALDKELGRALPIVVRLPPRSLFVISGLSRYHLQHGIPSLAADRLSLTFRTVNLACAESSAWRREWDAIPPDEASNAHWPLLAPAGSKGESYS